MAPCENGFLYPNEMSMLHLNLGIGVLAGYLREKGLKVDLYDMNSSIATKFEGLDQKAKFESFFHVDTFISYLKGESNLIIDDILKKMLSDINLDYYDSFGISVGGDYSLMQVHIGFLLGYYLKKKYNKPIFIGGNNISLMHIFNDLFKEFWDAVIDGIPYIVKGSGERAIWDIISSLNQGYDEKVIRDTKGLVGRIGNAITVNEEYSPQVIRPDWDGLDLKCYERHMCDEDKVKDSEAAIKSNLLHFFKWPGGFLGSPGQIVNKYNKLKAKNITPQIIIPYIFNYNCPYSCAFCTQSDFERGSVVGGSTDKVIEDIIFLKEKYHTKYFNFINNSFNFSSKFVDEFCKKVIAEGVEFYWSDCGRFNNLTYERLKLMREAGCVKLTFGLDTASEKMLKLVDKKLDIEHTENVLKWCKDLNIWVDLEIILGMPQEFDDDFNATFNYIERNYDYINYFWVNEYFVVPNSLIGRYPERYGIELIKDNKSYRGIMSENLKYFRNGETPSTLNAKLYGFNEIGGRKYHDILKDNRRRILQLNKAQRNEFYEASKFYKLLTQND